MTNEEIRQAIVEQQVIIGQQLEQNVGQFVLNPTILECKNKITELRKQCTHQKEDGSVVFTANGCCPYCGKKVR
jgi:hypothetical protein